MNKYEIATIRRRSRNNGINLCQYYVIIDSETKEIVKDGDWNIASKYGRSGAEYALKEMKKVKIELSQEQADTVRSILKNSKDELAVHALAILGLQ